MQRKKMWFSAIIFIVTNMFVSSVYADGEKIIVITHGADNDAVWDVFQQSLKDVGSALAVDITYLNPEAGSVAEMTDLISKASGQNPDGIVLTIPNINILKKSIKQAVDKNIPIIAINVGSNRQAESIGSLAHLRQPEYKAGFALGAKAKKQGVTDFLCVNHKINILSLEARCRGFADGLKVPFKAQMINSSEDEDKITKRVTSSLKANPKINSIVTLGTLPAMASLKAIESLGLNNDDIYFATFDISKGIITAMESSAIDIAVDNQPYLQGYLSIVLLANYLRYGILPAGNIDAGPAYITKENLDQVKGLVGKYR